MELGFIGLGRMGGNMTRRLIAAGHNVVVWDRSAETVHALSSIGATPAASLEALAATLTPPRAVWIMVPAGEPTEQTVGNLGELLGRGDVLVDGGNSYFKD